MADKLTLSWNDVQGMCGKLAREISISNWRPDYIVGLTRGGLTAATMLSHYFNVPMHTLKVSLRDADEECESNCWMAEDAFGYVRTEDRETYKSRWDPSLRKNILIVDDINDSGATLAWIKQDWMSSCLPTESTWETVWHNTVKFATLVENTASKESADFSATEVNKAEHDVWIDFPWEDWWEK